MIQISFQKKDMWLFFSLATFLVASGFVIAWGSNNPAIHGHDAGDIFACPAGFTKIESKGYVLGCMQTIEGGRGTLYCSRRLF